MARKRINISKGILVGSTNMTRLHEYKKYVVEVLYDKKHKILCKTNLKTRSAFVD